jgi:hypothetical protein
VNGDDPAYKRGWLSVFLRIKRENGGMPMDVCPVSFADPAHILNCWTQSTAETVLYHADLEPLDCFEKSPRRG